MSFKAITEKRVQEQTAKEALQKIESLIALAEQLDEASQGTLPFKVNLINQTSLRTLQATASRYEQRISVISQDIETIYKQNNICPKCDGQGSLIVTESEAQWSGADQFPCPRCKGSGNYYL